MNDVDSTSVTDGIGDLLCSLRKLRVAESSQPGNRTIMGTAQFQAIIEPATVRGDFNGKIKYLKGGT